MSGGPSFSRLLQVLREGATPDHELTRAALAECLAGDPPPDERLRSLTGFLVKAGEKVDWFNFDAAVHRWRQQGKMDAFALRNAIDASIAGKRPIEAAFMGINGGGRVMPPRPPELPAVPIDDAWLEHGDVSDFSEALAKPAICAPADYARDRAVYVADLARELFGSDADERADALTYLFSASSEERAERVVAALKDLRTPLPGYPFLAVRPAVEHFDYLTDALIRSRAAANRGVPPLLVLAQAKSGSSFVNGVIAAVYNIPIGAVSLGHIFGVRSWIEFASRHPIAVHDHMPPFPEHAERLADAGCRRIAFHVRDPRQLVVSLAHHAIAEKFAGNDRLGAIYEREGMKGLIDEMIPRFSPRTTAWLEGWLEATRKAGIETYISRQEDMRGNALGFFENLLGFLAPDAPRARPLDQVLAELRAEQQAGGYNFRKGTTDEWRQALTPEQAEAINAASGPAFRSLYPDLAQAAG